MEKEEEEQAEWVYPRGQHSKEEEESTQRLISGYTATGRRGTNIQKISGEERIRGPAGPLAKVQAKVEAKDGWAGGGQGREAVPGATQPPSESHPKQPPRKGSLLSQEAEGGLQSPRCFF